MVKPGNVKIGIVATPKDMEKLDYLCEKLQLKPTQVYRLALSAYFRKEIIED